MILRFILIISLSMFLSACGSEKSNVAIDAMSTAEDTQNVDARDEED